MAKIIEHNFSRKTGRAGRDLLASSFGCHMQELEERKALLGELVMQARLFLEQEGKDPRDFVLSEPYLREFLLPLCLGEEEEGGDDYLELVYLNCCGETALAVCQFTFLEEGEITVSYQIYSRDLGSGADPLWKRYNFRTHEWEDDEEDCFDLSFVLEEYGRFFHAPTDRQNKD